MDLCLGLLIPFLGTTLGAAMVFLMKNEMSTKLENILLRVCFWSYDCSISLVTFNSSTRDGRTARKNHVASSNNRIFAWNCIFACT